MSPKIKNSARNKQENESRLSLNTRFVYVKSSFTDIRLAPLQYNRKTNWHKMKMIIKLKETWAIKSISKSLTLKKVKADLVSQRFPFILKGKMIRNIEKSFETSKII